jgi:hypothetical protein
MENWLKPWSVPMLGKFANSAVQLVEKNDFGLVGFVYKILSCEKSTACTNEPFDKVRAALLCGPFA